MEVLSYRAMTASAISASAVPRGGAPSQSSSQSSSFPIKPTTNNSQSMRTPAALSISNSSQPRSISEKVVVPDHLTSTLDALTELTGMEQATNRAAAAAAKAKSKNGGKRTSSLFRFFAASFCNALENAVVDRFYKAEAAARNDDSASLGGLSSNYVAAEFEYGPSAPLSVAGVLPDCLNGEFLRVGPNSRFKPKGGYSWFDGDGMMHGLRIKNNKVSYTSRYVRTSRLSQEENYGAPLFLRSADCSGWRGLFWIALQALRVKLGVLDLAEGTGTANTALVFHNGKLLCLQETDRPYSVRVHDDGELETLGQYTFDRKLNHPFTAHPKIDPETGEMFVVGYQLSGTPWVTYRVVSKGGEMRDPVAIRIAGSNPLMMHDFAITEHYALFLDCPLLFKPKDMVFKNQGVFSFDKSQSTRIGILPRYAGDDSNIRWFEIPPCMILHTANAWEEGGDEVVMVACRSPSLTLESIDDVIRGKKDVDPSYVNDLYEFRFNLRTGESFERQLSDVALDFPSINPAYRGRKNRFVYTSLSAGLKGNGIVAGIGKFDLAEQPDLPMKDYLHAAEGTNVAGVFWFGEGRCGSEAVFVPASESASHDDGNEDDGYLIVFVFDEKKGKSEAVIIDAKTMSAKPVAVIQIPTRVPYGFHGLFVSENQLLEQDGFLSESTPFSTSLAI